MGAQARCPNCRGNKTYEVADYHVSKETGEPVRVTGGLAIALIIFGASMIIGTFLIIVTGVGGDGSIGGILMGLVALVFGLLRRRAAHKRSVKISGARRCKTCGHVYGGTAT